MIPSMKRRLRWERGTLFSFSNKANRRKGWARFSCIIGDNWQIKVKHTPSERGKSIEVEDRMRQEDTSLDYYDKFVFPQCVELISSLRIN